LVLEGQAHRDVTIYRMSPLWVPWDRTVRCQSRAGPRAPKGGGAQLPEQVRFRCHLMINGGGNYLAITDVKITDVRHVRELDFGL